MVTRGEAYHIGETGEGGVFRSNSPMLSTARVEAKKTGYATGAKTLGSSPGSTRIVLSRAGIIHGRVVRHDGTSPGAGIRVLATPAGEPWDAEYLALSRTHASLRCLALTDVQGAYSIDDVDSDGLYSILVGGNGVLGGPVYEVSPGDNPVPDIVVLELFGAIVQFIDEDGAPVTAPAQPSKQHYERTTVESRDAVRLGPASAPVHLLGVGGGDLDTKHQRLLLFASRDHHASRGSIGPVLFQTSFPGYSKASLRFLAEPVTSSVPVYELVHERTSDSFGSIDLNILGSSQPHSSRGRTSVIGRLELSPEDLSAPQVLAFDLRPDSEGIERIDHVPCGRYRPRVLLPNGSFQWPTTGAEPILEVFPNQISVLDVDGAALGSILLEVQFEDGSPYRGGLVVSLGEGEPVHQPDGSVLVSGGGDDVVFRHGPYLIEGLPAKTYSFKVRKPLNVQPDFHPIVVRVEPAEVHVLTLRMIDKR